MKIAGIKAPQLRDGIEGDIQRTLRFLAQGQGSFQQFGGLVGDCGRTGTVQLGNVAGGAGDGEEPVKPVQLGLHIGQCRLGGESHDSIHSKTFTGHLLTGTAGEGKEQEGYQSSHTAKELPLAVSVPLCGILSGKVPSHMKNSLSKRDSLG